MRGALLLPAALALLLPAVAVAAPRRAPVAVAAPVTIGQTPQPALSPGGYAYQLFIPRSYAPRGRQAAWPLMIFLHGSGERGTDLALVKVHGPPKKADQDPDFPFVVISPQMPEAAEDWDLAALNAILDHALKTLNVDPDRVYLTGLSRGAYGTLDWALANPERFAAIAPVAGRSDLARACVLKDMPAWFFHGDRDDAVDARGSFDMHRAIRACGGQPRLTVYPDLGHNSWDPAYDDPAFYLWLMKHRRHKVVPARQ